MKKLEGYKNGKTVWIGRFYPEKIGDRLNPKGKVYAEIYKTKIYAMKKDKKGFKKRYGDDAESVMYATATKIAKEKK